MLIKLISGMYCCGVSPSHTQCIAVFIPDTHPLSSAVRAVRGGVQQHFAYRWETNRQMFDRKDNPHVGTWTWYRLHERNMCGSESVSIVTNLSIHSQWTFIWWLPNLQCLSPTPLHLFGHIVIFLRVNGNAFFFLQLYDHLGHFTYRILCFSSSYCWCGSGSIVPGSDSLTC